MAALRRSPPHRRSEAGRTAESCSALVARCRATTRWHFNGRRSPAACGEDPRRCRRCAPRDAVIGPRHSGGCCCYSRAEPRGAIASKGRTAMDHYAGIDVSLATSSVCILDATGRVIQEAKIPSEPEALAAFLAGCSHHLVRIGLEAGPLSQWLYAGLVDAGLPAVRASERKSLKERLGSLAAAA